MASRTSWSWASPVLAVPTRAIRAMTRSSVVARCRASTTSRTVGGLAHSQPVTGLSDACSWSPRVRSTSRMVFAGTVPLRAQTSPPSASPMSTTRTTRPPMQARPPTRMRCISLPSHASSRLWPDAERLICHDHFMESTDEGSRAEIRRLLLVHDLHNLLKTLDHGFLEARFHQLDFIDAVQDLLTKRRRKGLVRHRFDTAHHLTLGPDTNTLFHQ